MSRPAQSPQGMGLRLPLNTSPLIADGSKRKARPVPDGERPGRRIVFQYSGSIHRFGRWDLMDRQTKHEIWILAIGTIVIEAPFLAVAALAWAAH